MRFSLIVPVYKVEQYIGQCVNSIISQDFKDYEVLLIDDGSPDSCGEICDNYAALYPNIRAFHKKNGGLSDARNFGLDHAIGEYIIFIDSDDWIAEGCLKIFDEIIGSDHPDIVETTLIEAYEGKIEIRDRDFANFLSQPFTRERAVKWACCLSYNTWPAPKKIYAASFLKTNNLRFLKGRLHEDIDWTSRILYNAITYKGCTIPWYFHRMGRNGSITSNIKAKNITDVIEIAKIHYDYFVENHDDTHEIVFNSIMGAVYAFINMTKKCPVEDRLKVVECIEQNFCIFEYAPKFSHKLFVHAMRLLGVKTAIKILCFI